MLFFNKVCLTICVLKFFAANCEENYNMKLEDLIVDFVNDYYFNLTTFDVSINYKTDSKNTLNIRIDVIRDLPETVFLKMKVWGRAFGQYKVPTGVSLDVNVCDNKLKKYFLEHILVNIGVDVTYCPPKKGIYEKRDLNPDINGLPLYALPGFHVLVETEVYSPDDIILLKMRTFSHIF